MKNTTLPPAAPSRMNPRNCPSACRSTNRDSAPPAVRQYSRSSTPVKLGNRRRTVRSIVHNAGGQTQQNGKTEGAELIRDLKGHRRLPE